MQSLSIAEAQEITFDTSAVPDIHAYLAGLRAHGPIARSKMGVVFALAPLSGIFCPVSTLPEWLQPVSWLLPSSHVFQGKRQLVFGQMLRTA